MLITANNRKVSPNQLLSAIANYNIPYNYTENNNVYWEKQFYKFKGQN